MVYISCRRITNISTQTRDVHRIGFESTSALELDNEYSGFAAQVNIGEDALMRRPEAERMLYEIVPVWATGAFAVAVFGGVLAIGASLVWYSRNAIAKAWIS
jgi:hypothetical protein